MESAISDEGDAPTTADSARTTVTKLAALWFRTHGLHDRLQTVAKHLAALITRMESRIPRGPPDFEMGPRPGIYLDYSGGPSPAPTQEPPWQAPILKILMMIICPLIVVGLPTLIGILFTMSNRLTKIEEHTNGNQQVVSQRLDAQDKHLEATDKQVEEIKRELWNRKH
jgi:hypothetical protein